MKIIALSDTHGKLPLYLEEGDYLLVGGDITPGKLNFSREGTKAWIDEEFGPWCEKFPGKVIVVAGNHDAGFTGCNGEDLGFPPNTVYLENEYWSDENIQIYGTPMCKPFRNWAFMYDLGTQEDIFSEFEGFVQDDRLKIILSHDAPYGVSDVILDSTCPWYTPENLGNMALRNLIERTKPDWNFHGHLHSSSHDIEMLGSTKVVCISYVNEKYQPFYRPYSLTM